MGFLITNSKYAIKQHHKNIFFFHIHFFQITKTRICTDFVFSLTDHWLANGNTAIILLHCLWFSDLLHFSCRCIEMLPFFMIISLYSKFMIISWHTVCQSLDLFAEKLRMMVVCFNISSYSIARTREDAEVIEDFVAKSLLLFLLAWQLSATEHEQMH